MLEIAQPSSLFPQPFCQSFTRDPTHGILSFGRTQWKEEIEEKTNDVFKVHIHHGKDKLKKLSAMKEKDVGSFKLPLPRVSYSQ